MLWAVTDMHGLAAMGDRSSWKHQGRPASLKSYLITIDMH